MWGERGLGGLRRRGSLRARKIVAEREDRNQGQRRPGDSGPEAPKKNMDSCHRVTIRLSMIYGKVLLMAASTSRAEERWKGAGHE
jgi:hypothetical protein